MTEKDSTIPGWDAYELLDSGDGRKLERFGEKVLDRPDPQAVWKKSKPTIWSKADAQFIWAEKGERWKSNKDMPDSWDISWQDIHLSLSLKGFKHVGIFPEHTLQWQELKLLGQRNPGLRMLNLFGYTGAASIVGSKAGMHVTHVDASKQTLATVKENMKLSDLADDALRIVCEDALRYVKRLVERAEQFEIILLDPPAFGRGPKGEVWKIEEKLQELVSLLPKLVSPNAKLVILNGYAAGFAARTVGELLHDVFEDKKISYGNIAIHQKDSTRLLTTGIYGKWEN